MFQKALDKLIGQNKKAVIRVEDVEGALEVEAEFKLVKSDLLAAGADHELGEIEVRDIKGISTDSGKLTIQL